MYLRCVCQTSSQPLGERACSSAREAVQPCVWTHTRLASSRANLYAPHRGGPCDYLRGPTSHQWGHSEGLTSQSRSPAQPRNLPSFQLDFLRSHADFCTDSRFPARKTGDLAHLVKDEIEYLGIFQDLNFELSFTFHFFTEFHKLIGQWAQTLLQNPAHYKNQR